VEPRIFRHGVIDSTSEEAFRELAAGRARHGDVFVAAGQSAGRGRRGARWESAAGGLYASFVGLPPPPAPPPAALTMAAGLAVLAAVCEVGLAAARLEWPNDVVVGRKKLAGVLVETRGLDPARPHYVVGVGLNVTQRRFSPELERERPVTSLALEGRATTPEEVLAILVRHALPCLERAQRDGDALAREWLDATGLVGQQVEVQRAAGSTVAGRLLRVTLAVGLCLETTDGARAHVALEHVRALARLAARSA
jgi:BirA family biotin operon repressor/biotin-[acetyl-CoA-carboxylase] ligase